MKIEPKLLDHPFYKAWSEGKISIEQLSNYAYAYQQIIDKIPYWWQKVLAAANKMQEYEWIVEEEKEHVHMWRQWRETLPEPTEKIDMSDFIEWMDSLSPAMLLGAINVFEMQQPQVANTKKEGLVNFYGYDFADVSLQYFNEHMKEEPHIKAGKELMQYFDKKEVEEGFKMAAHKWYETLNRFINDKEPIC